MRGALISITGIYNYDSTIFENLVIPDKMDKSLLINNLLMELGELSVVYPDANYLKFAIGAWSHRNIINWTKLLETTMFNYNPIENYDRNEIITDLSEHTIDRTEKEERDLNIKSTQSTTSQNESESDNTESQTAFNDYDFNDTRKNVVNGSENTTLETENSADDTGTVDNTGHEEGNNKNERTAHIHGNIGVTTTQQMIEEERKVLQFNMYDYIINQFREQFCIGVW